MRKGLMRGGLTKARAAGCALGAGLLWTAAAQAQQISDDVVRIGVLSDMSGLYADTAGGGSLAAAEMGGGSGEDTAEIPSPCKLLCRLLLLKKKKQKLNVILSATHILEY